MLTSLAKMEPSSDLCWFRQFFFFLALSGVLSFSDLEGCEMADEFDS